ncbi:MAG: sensor histidine kinase [Bacteroidota bacterium]|nr:sensor histidine kinase [Bacteroidota bacterium]
MKKILRLSVLLLILSVPHFGKASINDSLRKIASIKTDTAKVTALNDFALSISDNSDSAIFVSNKALELATKIKWDAGIGESYHFLGLFNSSKGTNKISLDCYFKALDIWEKLEAAATPENKNRVLYSKSKTFGNIGVVYMDLGDYPRALDYFFKALTLCEALKSKPGIATNLSNIGNIYIEQGYPDKGLDYYFRSLKVDEELKNKLGISTSLGNIGTVYDDYKHDYEKAIDYYSRALKLAEELNDKDGMAIWLGNIGMVYEKQKSYDKALDYYFRALAIAKETGNAITIAVELRAIGSLYSDQGKYKEAESYLLEALALDEESGALLQIIDDEQELNMLYSKTGRYALALDHYKKYTAAKDSLYNEENTAKFVRTEMNFEFEKKEAFQKAEHDKAVVAFEAENRIATNTRNFIIASAIMLLGMISLGFTWFNNRKNLKVKEEYSHQLIVSQEKERQRISKELHDSIGQNMLFIKNQLIKQNDTSLLASVNETLEEVRNISKDLYPNQLERYGLAAAVDALAEKVRETSSIFVSHDLEAFGKEIPSDKQINYYRIVQECISNAMKHSEASALRITAVATDGMIELIVQDNGKGFDKLSLAKKSQRSFGLLNIEERVNYLKGRFELQTSPGNGTKYTFNLPV